MLDLRARVAPACHLPVETLRPTMPALCGLQSFPTIGRMRKGPAGHIDVGMLPVSAPPGIRSIAVITAIPGSFPCRFRVLDR